MSSEEWHAFVLGAPAHTAALGVVRADGRPLVAPVWIDLDGDDVIFTTGADTVKGKAIRHDPRVCVMVDDERPPFSFVTIEGIAHVVDDLDELLKWATRIAGRYTGAERADEFGRRNAVPSELLVRVTPTRIVAKANISD
jgi:PPOX class probable F420-dependent enzyme